MIGSPAGLSRRASSPPLWKHYSPRDKEQLRRGAALSGRIIYKHEEKDADLSICVCGV